MRPSSPIELVLRKDRTVVLAGIALLTILAWTYIFYLAWDMRLSMSDGSMQTGVGMAMSQVRPWGTVDFLLMFVM